MADARFAKLFSEDDGDHHAIARYKLGGVAVSFEALETLNKKRLKTKDEIVKLLLACHRSEIGGCHTAEIGCHGQACQGQSFDKRIHHLLAQMPYGETEYPPVVLPEID